MQITQDQYKKYKDKLIKNKIEKLISEIQPVNNTFIIKHKNKTIKK